jgi:hypothetical protein
MAYHTFLMNRSFTVYKYLSILMSIVISLLTGCAAVPPARQTTYADTGDIVPVHENMVLFMSITEQEYQQLEQISQRDIFTVMDNYYAAMAGVIEKLNQRNIPYAATASKKIKFIYNNGNAEYYERLSDEAGIAYFGNGKKPLIAYGSPEAAQIINTIKEYFSLK